MAIGTSEVNAVLQTWANKFIEDVPAIHEGGKYLIEYNTLIDHLNNLTYDSLVNIMVETKVDFFD